MSDAALEYVQNLVKSGKSPQEIKTDLTSRGWEPEVVDHYLANVKSDSIPKSRGHSKAPLLILFIFLLLPLGSGGYYLYNKRLNPLITSDIRLTIPEYSASPSAELASEPPDDMSQLKAGFALLFAPPEYGYEATLSAQIAACQSTTKYISRHLPDSRYDEVTRTANNSCADYSGASSYSEIFRLPDQTLYRLSKNSKLETGANPPVNSDAEIKKYLASPENYTILESGGTEDGLIIKARLTTPQIEGTYQFTIRPFNHRISQVLFSATEQSTKGPILLTGDFVFMNRARIPTPPPSLIK